MTSQNVSSETPAKPLEHCEHECDGEVCKLYSADYDRMAKRPCTLTCRHDTRARPAPIRKPLHPCEENGCTDWENCDEICILHPDFQKKGKCCETCENIPCKVLDRVPCTHLPQPPADALDELRKKYVEISDTGICPRHGNEPDNCDSDRCGLCVLDVAIATIREQEAQKCRTPFLSCKSHIHICHYQKTR